MISGAFVVALVAVMSLLPGRRSTNLVRTSDEGLQTGTFVLSKVAEKGPMMTENGEPLTISPSTMKAFLATGTYSTVGH
jgi:hypothetical protein